MTAELTNLSISALRRGLDKKEFSSEELTRAFLDRIEEHKALNSFIRACPEEAQAAAHEADKKIASGEKAPLLGVPIAVKDMILTKGIPTTCASRILGNFIPPYDATVVQKLKAAGAFTIGKTNLDEFAMGSSNENSSFGPVRNPWDIERVPGGSSGGSAAAVSARLSPAALGTDTGGSIRQPASYCSLVGIKPTYGRVSRYGAVAFASSLDQVGVLASTVRDCALVTSIISGHDKYDSTSVDTPVPDFEAALGKEARGLRIGIPDEYFIPGMSKEVEEAVKAAIRTLEGLGTVPVRVSLPHTQAALATYYVLAPAEASSNLARYDGVRYGHRAKNARDLKDLYLRSRSEGFGREVKRRIMIGTYVLSTGYYDAYYLRAQKVRQLIARDFKSVFEAKCDLIVCPTAPSTAFKIGEKTADPLTMYLNDVFTIPVNLAGLPGMSIPCGFDSQGLPIGLQLIGKPWDEETLFKLAFAYEEASGWCRKLPPLCGQGSMQ